MKFSIVHENAGRMRIRLAVQRMTMEQADKMEAWLERQENVTAVTVHDNTCCAIIRYQGERQELIRQISGFSFQSAEVTAMENVHSNRALNREYQEKLVEHDLLARVAQALPAGPAAGSLYRVAQFALYWQGSALYLASEDGGGTAGRRCPSASPCSGGTLTRPVPSCSCWSWVSCWRSGRTKSPWTTWPAVCR